MAYHHVSIQRPALIALALTVAAVWRSIGEVDAAREHIAEARMLRLRAERARADAAERSLDATLNTLAREHAEGRIGDTSIEVGE